ncbi:hypothetical protein EMIHUDRAFT_455947 [Emiliania huxleyi CCMP1516]|uniref:C2 NT-type domain-containing protein n=2 Tax=Emiliania huxleyi TaxID=2903 RepID=A0A0D3KAX9_EMIH1|nr:hypothetical protein EMIHUDRAFT_455947 [Emiliania huxleyi CCMP1516]EOD32914.1 hypothetical protein EMIHUDRAFT_455947 [Emiliania huxleyi CCMP1516]|eukprot:XP_005785343.1 hypothetical protein EMIHUDRAFT_455947 [Emiliania huxleyi CCMP1516]
MATAKRKLKYQYFVTVHGLTFLPGGTCPSSNLSVLWTRGSKTAITQEAAADAQSRSAIFGQTLTLICTLFRSPSAASSSSGFSEKLCGFALIRHGSRGAQTLAKCKVDMAPFASAPPSAPLRRTLTLSKGSAAIAKLDVSISSRLQKELPRDGNDPSDRSDASSLSSCGSSLLDDVAYADDLDGELSERSGERAGERRSSRDGVSLGASRGAAAADGGVSASLASLTAGDLERAAACRISPQRSALRAEAAEPSRATVYSLDAQVSQLQAQLEAAQTLARKTHARFEGERREWGGERAQLREEAAGLRQQLIAADAASRQHAHESRQAAAQLGEARAEVARLRREKKELGSQLGPGGADADDRLAMQQDLQGKLDRSEQHREENARKLAKARKHQQSLLQQSEAEIELLSQR